MQDQDKKFGDILKEIRLENSATIEQISNATKIKPNTLVYLEASDLENLPKKVFIKGLIKSYCQFFNEDYKPVADILYNKQAVIAPEAPTATSEVSKPPKHKEAKVDKNILKRTSVKRTVFPAEMIRKTILPLSILALVLLGTATVFMISKSYLSKTSKQIVSSTKQNTIVSTPNKDNSDQEVANEESKQNDKKDGKENIRQDSKQAAADLKDTAPDNAKKAVEENKLKAVKIEIPEVAAATTDAISAKKDNILRLEPLDTTVIYIKTKTDTEPVKVILYTNKSRVFKFEAAQVRFLDAGAVNALFNGRDLGVMGKFREDKTVQFPLVPSSDI